MSKIRFTVGRIEHVHVTRTRSTISVWAFVYARNAAEAELLGSVCGQAAAAAIDSITFDGCVPWQPMGGDPRGGPDEWRPNPQA